MPVIWRTLINGPGAKSSHLKTERILFYIGWNKIIEISKFLAHKSHPVNADGQWTCRKYFKIGFLFSIFLTLLL